VPDRRHFVETVNKGVAAAKAGAFVTFGVKPTHPHTGYGYIQAADSDEVVKAVKCFVEKPDAETACSYFGVERILLECRGFSG